MSDVTVTLPVWLPLANLALGLVSLAALAFLTARAIRRGELHGPQAIAVTVFVWAAVLVIVGGSLSQLGLMSVEVWAVVGTGGRAVLAVGLLTVATLPPDDSIPELPESPNASRLARLEAAVAENTDLTVMAGKHADDAYATAADVQTTVGHTSEQVEEIHDATVGK